MRACPQAAGSGCFLAADNRGVEVEAYFRGGNLIYLQGPILHPTHCWRACSLYGSPPCMCWEEAVESGGEPMSWGEPGNRTRTCSSGCHFTHQPTDTFTSCKSLFTGEMKRTFFKVASGLKERRTIITCFLLLLVVSLISLYWRMLLNIALVDYLPVATAGLLRQTIILDDTLDYGARPRVQTRTPWEAPIIWEGMFDPDLYDQQHIQNQSSVALTVFAVGKYLDAYLKTFLTSAEKHFMPGLQVTYYVFTDLPDKVPIIELAPQRSLKVVEVEKHSRWQDISMMRMKVISEVIEAEIRHHCNYVFCFDVDQEFKGRFGSEALGDSVALLHAWFYKGPQSSFTYDRNPKSKAFMETGDYYYHAAIFGGLCENVKNLADYCFLNIMADKENNVEALWHDESHLNKYFWLHKPSRLLSPEYCWHPVIMDKSDINVTRLIWAPKHYDTLRTR